MQSLLVKYLLGEATPDETNRVDQWLSESEQNRRVYKEFKAAWEICRMVAMRPSTTNTEAALARFRQRQHRNEEPVENKDLDVKPPRSGSIYRSITKSQWRVAALLTGILLAGATMILVMHPAKKTELVAEKAIPAKSRDMVQKNNVDLPIVPVLQKIVSGGVVRIDTLPDKSVVTLNRHSMIEYDSRLSDSQRNVKLQGEAFFRITHDESKAFIVQVNDITVKDIGTSFNVLGAPGSTEITVESGKVMVTRGSYSLILRAGEKAIEIPGGRLKKELSRDELYGYYLDRPLVCDSMSLEILVKILNKGYNAHITIENKDLDDLRITTTFPAKLPLDRILNIIKETFDISVGRIGNRPLIILK